VLNLLWRTALTTVNVVVELCYFNSFHRLISVVSKFIGVFSKTNVFISVS
jgi:hypothetical protein